MIRDFTASRTRDLARHARSARPAPIFLALTEGMADGERRQVAFRACLIAFAILTFFALGGGEILSFSGSVCPPFASLAACCSFWIAFEMVFQARGERKAQAAQSAITIDRIRNVAAFPLAMPRCSRGPARSRPRSCSPAAPVRIRAFSPSSSRSSVPCSPAAPSVFLVAQRFARLLGITGNIVLTRLLGVILAALAVQFIMDGAVAALTYRANRNRRSCAAQVREFRPLHRGCRLTAKADKPPALTHLIELLDRARSLKKAASHEFDPRQNGMSSSSSPAYLPPPPPAGAGAGRRLHWRRAPNWAAPASPASSMLAPGPPPRESRSVSSPRKRCQTTSVERRLLPC